VSATANATGLKICLFPIAKIYFDAMAHTDAKIKNPTPATFVAATGVIIRARMSAVIYTDSTFVCALYTRANIQFVTQHTRVIKKVENASVVGSFGMIPKKPNTNDTKSSATR